MEPPVLHMSEADAVRDMAGILRHVGAGMEVVIERDTEPVEQLKAAYGEIEIGLSVVTVVELTHGIHRAKEEGQRQRRQAFVDELIRDVHPITIGTARLAGRIEGEQAEHGVTIAFEDLLIAATAPQLGCGVAAGNVRHFEHVPGLNVVEA
jgi:tRNA(fMet)-specific endonuclease VapC